jgi:hypothetical protein
MAKDLNEWVISRYISSSLLAIFAISKNFLKLFQSSVSLRP